MAIISITQVYFVDGFLPVRIKIRFVQPFDAVEEVPYACEGDLKGSLEVSEVRMLT